MKYRICEYCGDHLDFGEQCDCRKGVKPIQFEKMLEENHKRLEEEKFFSQNATSNELLVKKSETLEKDNVTENYLNSEKVREYLNKINETTFKAKLENFG